MVRRDLDRLPVPGLHGDRAAEVLDLERDPGLHDDRRVGLRKERFARGDDRLMVPALCREGGGPREQRDGGEQRGGQGCAHYRDPSALDALASIVARCRSSTLRLIVSARCSLTSVFPGSAASARLAWAIAKSMMARLDSRVRM